MLLARCCVSCRTRALIASGARARRFPAMANGVAAAAAAPAAAAATEVATFSAHCWLHTCHPTRTISALFLTPCIAGLAGGRAATKAGSVEVIEHCWQDEGSTMRAPLVCVVLAAACAGTNNACLYPHGVVPLAVHSRTVVRSEATAA